jgi:diguanylate cyclase (GGDEF)-like protein
MRGADSPIRWGGEEFLVLLPETGADIAVIVAERMRRAIAAVEIVSATGTIRITVSVGVAESSTLDGSAADVLRRADMALYNAKETGRNRVVRHS